MRGEFGSYCTCLDLMVITPLGLSLAVIIETSSPTLNPATATISSDLSKEFTEFPPLFFIIRSLIFSAA